MSYEKGGNCWNCATELTAIDYGRNDSCPKCGRDTKTCKGCGFFDPSYNNQCKENQAERVVDKERSNFCDYFVPSSKNGPGTQSKADLKAAAEALFKKN